MKKLECCLARWLIVLGALLILGGIAEAVYLLIVGSGTVPLWLALLAGPLTHIGLGAVLWAVADD